MDEETSTEETLRRQLMATSVSVEINRVIASSPDLENVYRTLVLGLQDMMSFRKVALFGLDPAGFRLKPLCSTGMDHSALASMEFGLGFLDGEYGDAVFRNRHVIVESVPDEDPFLCLGSTSYVVFPVTGRIRLGLPETGTEGSSICKRAEEPFCWSTGWENSLPPGTSEDDRRRKCLQCPEFQCLALLWIDLTERTMITGDEVGIVLSIVAQTGLVLERFAIYDQLRANHERLRASNAALEEAHRIIRRDLRQAHSIQKKLLPTNFPTWLPDVEAHYVPHSEVGGDYFDCFSLPDGRLCMLIADVSGHGVGAALVMAMFKMLLKTRLDLLTTSPTLALEQINNAFLRELDADRFVTVFLGVFDPSTRELLYSSAGHEPALLLSRENNSLTLLKSRGRFVGVLDDLGLSDSRITLEGPHRILLFTDGVTEASNGKREQFGLDRLQQICLDNLSSPLKPLVSTILDELDLFTGEEPLHDDVTLLVIDL